MNVYNRFKETGRFDALRCDWREGAPNKPGLSMLLVLVGAFFFEVCKKYFLKNIVCAASNLELPGMAAFGSPSVLVEGLSIAGK